VRTGTGRWGTGARAGCRVRLRSTDTHPLLVPICFSHARTCPLLPPIADKWTIGFAWASDYGTVEQSAEMFAYLKKISPVHNININVRGDSAYPALLLCTSDHDDRVVPLHSYKFISAVQATVAGHPDQSAPLLIRMSAHLFVRSSSFHFTSHFE
jgi:hypothetical protein